MTIPHRNPSPHTFTPTLSGPWGLMAWKKGVFTRIGNRGNEKRGAVSRCTPPLYDATLARPGDVLPVQLAG